MPFFICIVSAFFWAIFDLTRKISLQHVEPKILLFLFTLVQLIIFFIWIILDEFSITFYDYLVPGIVLVVIGVISAILFLKAIFNSELSLTIPLLSFSPIFSSIFAFIFLEEKLRLIQYIGVFFILIGTLVLYAKRLNLESILLSFKTIKKNLSAKLMLLVALMWSITPVLDKICLKNSTINIHGFIQSMGMLFFLFLLIGRNFLNQIQKIKKNTLKIISLTLFVGTTATILQLYAITINFVPIMEAIKRAIGQFSSVFFGKIFFREKITYQKIIGVFFLSIGVTFILQ